MQGTQEAPRPNTGEAGNHLSAGATLGPKCSQGPLLAHSMGTPPSLLLPYPAWVLLQGLRLDLQTPLLPSPLSSSPRRWNSQFSTLLTQLHVSSCVEGRGAVSYSGSK